MDNQTENQLHKCPLCEKELKSILSLCTHWHKIHKLSRKELYLKTHNLDHEPTCKCGCGSQVKFLDNGRGFSEYVRRHSARVKNNYQANPETFQKSLKTRKK